jgi:hypothetical protein
MSSSANPCLNFFESVAQSKDKAGDLQKTGNAIQWESLTASVHSPGPIQNKEILLRLVINPLHIDPADGSIKPSLVSDVKDKGASCQRLGYGTEDEAIQAGRTLATSKNAAAPDKPPRSVYGTVKFSVSEIRALVVASNSRAFGVFDTALPTNGSHADIFQLVNSPQEARSARLQLFQLAANAFKVA